MVLIKVCQKLSSNISCHNVHVMTSPRAAHDLLGQRPRGGNLVPKGPGLADSGKRFLGVRTFGVFDFSIWNTLTASISSLAVGDPVYSSEK